MKINKLICDNCGKEDLDELIPLQLNCGFGSIFDGSVFDFCSEECCVKFIQKKLDEIKKKGSYDLPLRKKLEEKLKDKIKEVKNDKNIRN